MTDEASDDIKPWTIKGITPEIRSAATSAAGRANQTIGEFVSRAILAQVKEDVGQSRAVAVVPPANVAVAASPYLPVPVVDVEALERLTDIACKVSHVDMHIDEVARKRITSLVRRGLRGLSPAKSPLRETADA